jgi:hypothetical protein
MSQRKTPRLAFCEYVSPETENSEEVYRARLELMRIVKRVLPRFLERLFDEVFPLYEQLAKGGYDFDQILWTNSSPYALLKDDGGLKKALSKWTAEFNAEAEWLMDEALRTLRGWHEVPDYRAMLEWSPVHAETGPPGIGKPFEFFYPKWETRSCTWLDFSESLRQRFKKKLSAYERETRGLAKSQGLVRARRKYSPANLEWFVLYQFAGMSSKEITDHHPTNDKAVDESTVLKGIKTAQKLIAWGDLRKPGPARSRKIR